MTIVTTSYRPKRAPSKKRQQPPITNRIVMPAKLKPIKGPVIRLRGQVPDKINDNGLKPPGRSAIVTPQRKPRISNFGLAPDLDPDELQRRGEADDALFREIVRRATGKPFQR